MIDFIPNKRLFNLLAKDRSLVKDFEKKCNLIERFSIILRTTNFNTICLLDALQSLTQSDQMNFKSSIKIIKLHADTILTALSVLESMVSFNPVYPVETFYYVKGNLFLLLSTVKIVKDLVENHNDFSLLKQKINLLSNEFTTVKDLCFDYVSYYEMVDFCLFNGRN